MILFSSRENSRPSLCMFIVKIKEIEAIEQNIARNKYIIIIIIIIIK